MKAVWAHFSRNSVGLEDDVWPHEMFVIALFVIVCDRVLKILTNKSQLRGSIGIVRFAHLHNHGAMMGILRGDRILLGEVGLVVVVALVIPWFKSRLSSPLFWIGWALLMGGTVRNLLDRLIYGYVTDMLDIPGYPAVFNVADIAIRIGFIMMFIGYRRGSRKESLKDQMHVIRHITITGNG